MFAGRFLPEFDANLPLCNTQQGYSPLGSAVAEARADKEGESSPVAESSDDSSGRRVHGSGELRASLDFTFSGICGFLMGICTIA